MRSQLKGDQSEHWVWAPVSLGESQVHPGMWRNLRRFAVKKLDVFVNTIWFLDCSKETYLSP